ncbi:MAG: response regulator [Gammaproteobacteria bacterium]|nr:response regulator [Gammaproteobacteria bacterium]MBU1488781.1 response regulator [Gammaproteobacteria bacterium]MBU2218045.1 response regulator [Gammaproteobacteria bacterium]MBU2322461.1 response regulator [Gammaproteobacteria bacterium]
MDDRSPAPSLHMRLPIGVSLLLLLILNGVVVWQWRLLDARNEEALQQRFQLEVQGIGQQVETRMRAYEMTLRGLSGLMIGSDQVTAEEWQEAVDQLQIEERYPGVLALGWARRLGREQLDTFIREVREDGRETYPKPREPAEEYVLVDFVSPPTRQNRQTEGYDMLGHPSRQVAIETARRSGQAVLSAPLTLRQDGDDNQLTGVLLYLPVYADDAALQDPEARSQALSGVVYGAFRSQELMAGILGPQGRLFSIAIRDQAANGRELLSIEQLEALHASRFRQQLELPLYGRIWLLDVASTPLYDAALGKGHSQFGLWLALCAASLLALLIGGYLYVRERELSRSRRATELLREREERFRQLVERLPVATLLCDAQGRIEMANLRAVELLNCPLAGLQGERVRRFIPVLGGLADLADELGDTAATRDYDLCPDSGGALPVSLSLCALTDSAGTTYLLNLVDLRLRKSADERFRLVVDASPNAIVLVDSRGQIAMVNRQTEQLFGHARDAMLGQPVEMLLPEALRKGHVPYRQGYQVSPEPRRMGGNRDLFGQHRDGHLIPLEVGLSPLHSGGEVLVQAVIIDISERKAAEQRLREQAEQLVLANRYKSEFLANMSHELRTPLNSILILSDQLRQNTTGNLSEKQTKHADIVYRAGSDLLQLINNILDLAKVESGRMQLKIEPMDLQEMLVELDAGMRPMAELKGLRLQTRLADAVPRLVLADRVRLTQILRNLLSNALKFTEQGDVSLLVDAERQGEGELEWLSFIVQDSGIGIAADQHELIFQAFQQIDGSTSRRFGGTGLGLAITRQLVQALDGEIELRSAPGQGACFIVRLPVQIATVQEPATSGAQPVRRGAGSTVLIVEDDANFAAVLVEEAQAHGFASVHCRTGLQALALLQQEHFSAVVLDILLPDISGWQLFRRLRSQASYRHVPVHIISCVPQPADWNEDGTRYLVKPISQDDLAAVFARLQHDSDTPQQALLLVEDVPVEREHYREYLQHLGFAVHACADGSEAVAAYREQSFAALVVDLDLPDQDGFALLEQLDQIRPLAGQRIVVNTGVDVGQRHLQLLRRFSAVVVRKQGDDLQQLSQAVQGFLERVPASTLSAPEPRAHRLQGRRVLLVDDDIRNVYALSALLDEAGLQISTAKDGAEAIERFLQGGHDLILMDMAMPIMDGYTATRLLKQEHGCQIPIIALTAHAMKGDRDKCLACGADDYLAKPVGQDELLERLLHWLEVGSAG